MEKYEKEILQSYIDGEKTILKAIEEVYRAALEKVNEKIAALLAIKGENARQAIYQAEYQKAVREQIKAVLDDMHAEEFETVSDYLSRSYEDGFTNTMYALHKQDIPLLLPINRKLVARAVLHDTKLKESLYKSLGFDVAKLKKTIAQEISRGFASGMLYSEMVQNIQNATLLAKRRVRTIVRTEAGRIQEQATMDAANEAKKAGARVVKQWCAIRDGRTRPTHRRLHNQIREVEEPFEIDGKTAMQPHGFGLPEEDCNCRCTTLIRARAALDADELKQMQEDAEFWGLDKAKDLEEFKRKYLDAIKDK